MRIYYSIILCLLIFLTTGAVCSEIDPTVKEIQQKYEAGDVAGAELTALKALNKRDNFQSPELVEIHKYLALCYIARGERQDAVDEFVAVLKINPQFRFRRQVTSPKVISVFDEALREFQNFLALRRDNPPLEADVRWRSAAVRSIIFPGLGQLHKGDKRKGYIFTGVGIASISGLIFTQIMYSKAHEDYLDAEEIQDIEKKYEDFNTYYKLRNSTAILSAAIYLYNIYDCITVPPKNIESKLTIQIDPNRLALIYNF